MLPPLWMAQQVHDRCLRGVARDQVWAHLACLEAYAADGFGCDLERYVCRSCQRRRPLAQSPNHGRRPPSARAPSRSPPQQRHFPAAHLGKSKFAYLSFHMGYVQNARN